MKKEVLLVLSVFVILMASCSNEEIVPEVTFPQGSIDYFEESLDFGSNADEKTISFSSNVPWTISVDETRNGSTWCTVSPSQGDAGTANVKIHVDENTSYDDRNAVLRLSYGEFTKDIFVNQKQLDAITLTANRFEVPAEGGTVNIEVNANIGYSVVIEENCSHWIHQTSSAGTKALSTTSLQFQIDPSEEYEQREGKIVIQGENKSETVTIYQFGEAILSLTNKNFNLDSSEQNIVIEVNSNFEYEVSMPEVDWISEIQSRGLSTHTINLHIAENTTYDNRTASIRLYDKNSDISEEVVINQSQLNAIELETTEYEFDENGGTFTVHLNSNVDYQVTITDDWITGEVSTNTRALEAYAHTFKVAPLIGLDREAKIIFSDTATGVSAEVLVKQLSSLSFGSASFSMMANATLQLELINRTEQSVSFVSSDETIATVSQSGLVSALSRGKVVITATTADGKHTCSCEIIVQDITDYISAMSIGGSVVSINGQIKYGSKLNWRFTNNSNESVTLKSLQLIGGNGYEGNLMGVDATVSANSSVSYTTTVGLLGIYAPVTCRFRYEYKGKEYFVDAVYD